MCPHGERELELTGVFYENTNYRIKAPTLVTSFNLNYLCKGPSPISTYCHIEGSGLQHELGAHNSVYIMGTDSCQGLALVQVLLQQ